MGFNLTLSGTTNVPGNVGGTNVSFDPTANVQGQAHLAGGARHLDNRRPWRPETTWPPVSAQRNGSRGPRLALLAAGAAAIMLKRRSRRR